MKRWRWEDGVTVAETRGSYGRHRQRWPDVWTLRAYRWAAYNAYGGASAEIAALRSVAQEVPAVWREAIDDALRRADW